jgi:peptide chain release factor 2
MQDLVEQILLNKQKVDELIRNINLDKVKDSLISAQRESQNPDLWEDREHAQNVLKQVNDLQDEINEWEHLSARVNDALELSKLNDESLRPELEKEIGDLDKEIERKGLSTLLSGKHDIGNAILAIHAGAGGTEAHDWASMLQRMFLRWAEDHKYTCDIVDFTPGEEAGTKSITITVTGKYAFGYLKSEKGTHRLVRLSPFDAAHRRHTSFAMVEVLPEAIDDDSIEIPQEDIRIDVYKSSGAGGQNVQKNSTAVRLLHIPTGIIVTCQNERSQTQNRENAMKVLKSRLLDIKHQEQEKELGELRGEYVKAEWGSQIRSYVLHPYQMVKDHRTDYEVGNAQMVLDGGIDGFIEAYLKFLRKSK